MGVRFSVSLKDRESLHVLNDLDHIYDMDISCHVHVITLEIVFRCKLTLFQHLATGSVDRLLANFLDSKFERGSLDFACPDVGFGRRRGSK